MKGETNVAERSFKSFPLILQYDDTVSTSSSQFKRWPLLQERMSLEETFINEWFPSMQWAVIAESSFFFLLKAVRCSDNLTEKGSVACKAIDSRLSCWRYGILGVNKLCASISLLNCFLSIYVVLAHKKI